MGNNKLILLILLLALGSCNQQINSKKDISAFINDPDNGTVVTKKSGHHELTISWLPPEVQVLSEMRGYDKVSLHLFDSLIQTYNQAIAFKFEIKPEPTKKGKPDLLKGTTGSYLDYKEIFQELNFNLGQYISMKWDGRVLAPALTRMENTYGLTSHRTFLLVFSAPDSTTKWSGEADLIFTDDFFGTGINHFVFDLNRCLLPELNIDKILHTI